MAFICAVITVAADSYMQSALLRHQPCPALPSPAKSHQLLAVSVLRYVSAMDIKLRLHAGTVSLPHPSTPSSDVWLSGWARSGRAAVFWRPTLTLASSQLTGMQILQALTQHWTQLSLVHHSHLQLSVTMVCGAL